MKTTLPTKIQNLVDTLIAEQRLTPGLASRVLAESDITPADLQAWADFDHPLADSYGRRLIFDGGFFELMAMSWMPGDMSMIHDHGYTEWGAVQLFGPAEHAVFKIEDGVLRTADRFICEWGQILPVGHDLIHQMGNVDDKPFFSLHLYGCYGREGDITADAHLYALHEKTIQLTSGGVFFDLDEAAINERKEGPVADFATWLRYHVEYLKRLMTKHNSFAYGHWHGARQAELAEILFARETWVALQAYMAELESSSSRAVVQYRHILAQELWAAAQMQWELIAHNFVTTPLNAHEGTLVALLTEADLDAFVTEYVALLTAVYDLEQLPVAA